MCVDCNSTTLPSGIDGQNGWSPKLAVVTVTCDLVEHEVLQLVGWIGGSGTKPLYSGNEMTDSWLTSNPLYLSSSGFTASGCAGTFIEGTDGIYGGFSSNFVFSTTTSISPSSTQLRFNSATYGSVTRIWVSETNGSSIDVTDWLNSFDNNGNFGTVRIFKEYDSTKFWYGTVTNVTDSGSYFTLDVTYIDHNSSFTNGDNIVMSFTMNGNAASITVEETDGTPTGTPTTLKFGPGTLTYSTTTTTDDTITYDPEGDWVNIPYSSGDIVNADTNPFYTGTHSANGSWVGASFFRPYRGTQTNWTGDAAIRRLKYKINDDKTISFTGHLEGEFEYTSGSYNLNMYDDGVTNRMPVASPKFFSPNCLLKYIFPSAITNFGTTVHQFPCDIIVTIGGLGEVINLKEFVVSAKGLVNLYSDYIQIECIDNVTTDLSSYVSLDGFYSIHVIIDHTVAKRTGA